MFLNKMYTNKYNAVYSKREGERGKKEMSFWYLQGSLTFMRGYMVKKAKNSKIAQSNLEQKYPEKGKQEISEKKNRKK